MQMHAIKYVHATSSKATTTATSTHMYAKTYVNWEVLEMHIATAANKLVCCVCRLKFMTADILRLHTDESDIRPKYDSIFLIQGPP